MKTKTVFCLAFFLFVFLYFSFFLFFLFFPSVLPLFLFLFSFLPCFPFFPSFLFFIFSFFFLSFFFFFFFFFCFFCFFFFSSSSSPLVPLLLLLLQVPLLLLLLLLAFRKPTPPKTEKEQKTQKHSPKRGQKNLLPPVFGANMSHLTRCPPRLQGEKGTNALPLVFRGALVTNSRAKTTYPPEKRGRKGVKKRKKMGTKSWVLKWTLNRAEKIWAISAKKQKKRISHYVFACFVHIGSTFWVHLSTRQHIYIHILILFFFCIYSCDVRFWTKLGVSKVRFWTNFL